MMSSGVKNLIGPLLLLVWIRFYRTWPLVGSILNRTFPAGLLANFNETLSNFRNNCTNSSYSSSEILGKVDKPSSYFITCRIILVESLDSHCQIALWIKCECFWKWYFLSPFLNYSCFMFLGTQSQFNIWILHCSLDYHFGHDFSVPCKITLKWWDIEAHYFYYFISIICLYVE